MSGGAEVGSVPGNARPVPAERPTIGLSKLWFWAPIVPLVALDLWSKAAAFGFLRDRWPDSFARERWEVWHWEMRIRFSLVAVWNPGTIWGLGGSLHDLLVAARFFAIGVLIWFAAKTPRRSRLQQAVLGAILAGAVGNLYDNLTEREPVHLGGGGVRDFLLFEFGPRYAAFPAFNVADSCITVGAVALALLLWRSDRK